MCVCVCVCVAVQQDLAGPVCQVIKETLPQLTGSLDSKELNEKFLEKHSDSLPHLIAGMAIVIALYLKMVQHGVLLHRSTGDVQAESRVKRQSCGHSNQSVRWSKGTHTKSEIFPSLVCCTNFNCSIL